MPHTDLIIVGGGWAGLSAATAAVQSGLRVKLFELSTELGGRSGSFRDNNFQEWLDVGPHVFVGAYKRTLDLLNIWGSRGGIDFTEGGAIPWIYPKGRIEWLKGGNSSSRLSALINLLSFGSISLNDRIRTVNVLRTVANLDKFNPDYEPTVKGFLRKFGIDTGRNVFWHALTVAVMNGAPEVVGAWPLIRSLKEGLIEGGTISRIGVTRKDFKNFFCDRAEEFLTSRGCSIFKKSPVRKILVDNSGNISGINLKDTVVKSDKVLLSVSPSDVQQLLPEKYRREVFFSRFSGFEYSPIASVHINYTHPVLKHPFSCLPGGLAEWVFGRGKKEAKGWSRVNTVTSNSPGRGEIPRDIFVHRVISELAEKIPAAKPQYVNLARLVRMNRATIVLKPGSDLIRPSPETPIKGLYLAGDWCGTKLPATIESAARSGWDAVKQLRKL